MTISALINELHAKGIVLRHEGGQLKLKAPKGALTDDLREKLVSNKPGIIAFLQEISATKKVPPILPVSRAEEDGTLIESFPLSFAQERLWFIDQLEPNSSVYNIPAAVTISGGADGRPLEFDHLEQTFNLMIARHENLRTIFPSNEGQAQQVILDRFDFKLERIDLSDHKRNETRHEKARQLCQTEAAKPFDLTIGPLIRGKLIKLTDQEHVLMLTMHHIISDGWSMGIMIKEFGVIMDCLQQGRNPHESPGLPSLPIQYLDYSVWQRKMLGEGGVLKQQLDYWQEKLASVPVVLNLPTDYPRPSVQRFSGSRQAFRFDAELTDQLKSLAEQQGCTLYMVLLAAFKVLLYRYSGEKDICLGSPIANRQNEEVEGLIGMFINTLVLRSQLQGDASFISLLAQVKATCLDAYEHQDTPFERIVDLVQPGRNMAVSPLFQIMFILQNAPEESTEQHIRPYPLNSDISKFDLTIACTEIREGLEGTIEYRTSLYNPLTIERMARHFEALCQAITSRPADHISELEFIGEAEKQLLLVGYNNVEANYLKDTCIHQLLGRRDTQVKIRGYSIELQEIEAQLNLYLGIKDSVVLTQGQDSNKQLIAFYLSKDTAVNKNVRSFDEGLKKHVQQTLPEYMRPVMFVRLETIPLTPNGKVDRRALTLMNVNLELIKSYQAPRNEMEEQLVAIWAEVLKLGPEKIGVNDNFFELGGHSLLAIQVVSKIRGQLGIDVPLKAMFNASTLAGISELIQVTKTQHEKPLLDVDLTDVQFEGTSL